MSDLLNAIDVSSHQPADLSLIIRAYTPDIVIPKLYQPFESAKERGWNSQMTQQHSLNQIESSYENGAEVVSGYMWPYSGQDMAAGVHNAVELGARAIREFWWLGLDIETYPPDRSIPNGNEIQELVRECRGLGLIPVLYWSQEMHRRAGSPYEGLEDELHWLASFGLTVGPPASLEVVKIFGGWSQDQVVGHQWTSNEIDRSVFKPFWRKDNNVPEESQEVIYETVNGPRSEREMQEELINAGWQGFNDEGEPEEVIAAYERTSQGPVTLNVPEPPTEEPTEPAPFDYSGYSGADLVNELGYVRGDVARAVLAGIENVEADLRAVQRGLDEIRAAYNTLANRS